MTAKKFSYTAIWQQTTVAVLRGDTMLHHSFTLKHLQELLVES